MIEATPASSMVSAVEEGHKPSLFSVQPFALNRQHQRAVSHPPVARTSPQQLDGPYDTLRISITRHADHDQPFLVRVMRRGSLSVYGPLQHHDRVSRVQVAALQRSYVQQLQLLREMTVAGLPVPPLDRSRLLDLGRAVANMLPLNAQQEIVAAVRRTVQRHRQLRLTLEVAPDAQELLCIPWELMALPSDWSTPSSSEEATFLLLNAHVTLTRQVRGVGRRDARPLRYPLRVQAFAATPRYAQTIALDETCAAIRQTQLPNREGRSWYDGPGTVNELIERLHTTNPQIVHLLCHGERDDTGSRIRYSLLLADPDGYPQPVCAQSLAQALTLAHNLQLVVLQACHAGEAALRCIGGGEHHGVESIALSLIRAGVPAVIAMQGEVEQQAASMFIRTCYTGLANGARIDKAVAAGRIAMSVVGGSADWSLPVLYQGSNPSGQHDWHVQLVHQIRRLMRQS